MDSVSAKLRVGGARRPGSSFKVVILWDLLPIVWALGLISRDGDCLVLSCWIHSFDDSNGVNPPDETSSLH